MSSDDKFLLALGVLGVVGIVGVAAATSKTSVTHVVVLPRRLARGRSRAIDMRRCARCRGFFLLTPEERAYPTIGRCRSDVVRAVPCAVFSPDTTCPDECGRCSACVRRFRDTRRCRRSLAVPRR
jgi:hypothetical protein